MRGGERFFAHIKCYNCNEMGHYANDCKVASRNPTAAVSATSSSTSDGNFAATASTPGMQRRGLRGGGRGAPRGSPAPALARGLTRKRPHPGSEPEGGQRAMGTPKLARPSEW